MASVLPEKFEKVRHALPTFASGRVFRMEETTAIQVVWAEKFASAYPAVAGRGRPFHSSQDTPVETSIETHMCGEPETYSSQTEVLYPDFVLIANPRSGIRPQKSEPISFAFLDGIPRSRLSSNIRVS